MVKINFFSVTRANFRAGYACTGKLSFDWLAFAVKLVLVGNCVRAYLIGLCGLEPRTVARKGKCIPIARSLGATIDYIIYGATGRDILTNCYLLQFYKFLDINNTLIAFP